MKPSEETEYLKAEIELKRKDIFLLVAALRDIYAMRGEDKYIAKTVEEALERLTTAA